MKSANTFLESFLIIQMFGRGSQGLNYILRYRRPGNSYSFLRELFFPVLFKIKSRQRSRQREKTSKMASFICLNMIDYYLKPVSLPGTLLSIHLKSGLFVHFLICTNLLLRNANKDSGPFKTLSLSQRIEKYMQRIVF